MPGRLLALGDIHGHADALDAVLEAADLQADDTLVTLGDYVDRGPDSRGVIDRLIALQERCRLVALRGNHDLLFSQALDLLDKDPSRFEQYLDEPNLRLWARCGGLETIDSYGTLFDVPPEHRTFLNRLVDWHETEQLLFSHANYDPDLPMADQPLAMLHWMSLRDFEPGPHQSGKTALVGHTAQKSGEILDLGHLICIDTFCYGGGWLTLLDTHSGFLWQADRQGRLRDILTTG